MITCNNRFSILDSDKLLSDTTVNEVAQKNYADQILNVAQYSNYGKVFIKPKQTQSKEAPGTNPENKDKSTQKGCEASMAQSTKEVEEVPTKKEPKEEIVRISRTQISKEPGSMKLARLKRDERKPLNKKEMLVQVKLETLDSGKRYMTKVILDSGCQKSSINKDYVQRNGIETKKLETLL